MHSRHQNEVRNVVNAVTQEGGREGKRDGFETGNCCMPLLSYLMSFSHLQYHL